MICKRCYVSGRVQGVFFRHSTLRQAEELGVTGYATNLADGRVEVLACGEERAVDALIRWLHDGPRMAEVDGLRVEPANGETPPERFTTG